MAQLETQSIPREQFLNIATDMLYRMFVDAPRTDAKKVFRDIQEGRSVRLTTLEMEDKSTVAFYLSMDCSEFRGKLNYSAFRASVGTLIGNLAGTLKEGKEIQTFGAAEQADTMIFGVTALTVEDEQPNVMVLSTATATVDASVVLRLLYLDPEQFVERVEKPADEGTA